MSDPKPKKIKDDYSCGVVPCRVVEGVREYLLVQHHAGHWAFPKGHPEADESPIQTAARELAEETGLAQADLLEAPAFEEAYTFTKRSGTQVRKLVTYFLGQVSADAQVTAQPEEICAIAWGDAQATRARLTFDEGRRLFEEVEAYLAQPTAD